jgi:PIN domain
MSERILLVDYENIQAVNLQSLPDAVKVRFVLGGKQGKLPSDLAVHAHAMGDRFAYVRILSVERNACDFCIAFYLGEYLNQNPKAECVILSKDKKGFDPLVQHLTAERGFNVRRVGAQKDAFPEDHAPGSRNEFERLTSLLRKEKAQPRKRKGLEGKIKSWFPTLPGKERDELVKRLFDEGFVSESDKLLTFVSARFRGM